MRIWYDNEFDKYTLTASEEKANYPASNLKDFQLEKTTRSTSAGAVITYDLDAGSGNTIYATGAAIWNHNISTAATSIQFVMAATTSFANASTSVTFTHNVDWMTVYFTADNKRYARFLIEDTANVDDYIEIGRLFITSYLQVVGGVGIDFPFQILDSTTGQYSNTGQWFSDEGENLDLYHFTISLADNAYKKRLVTMFKDVKMSKPIIFDFNECAHSSIQPLYCKFNDEINFNHVAVCINDTTWDFHWNASISIKECK